MNKIFQGEEASNCDGGISGLSTFLYMIRGPGSKKESDDKFIEMIMKGFKPDTHNDYVFQHKYRSRSIQFFYIKDMITGLLVLGVSIGI